jgi:hypothetical protein
LNLPIVSEFKNAEINIGNILSNKSLVIVASNQIRLNTLIRNIKLLVIKAGLNTSICALSNGPLVYMSRSFRGLSVIRYAHIEGGRVHRRETA